jgi:hypothetical protein
MLALSDTACADAAKSGAPSRSIVQSIRVKCLILISVKCH